MPRFLLVGMNNFYASVEQQDRPDVLPAERVGRVAVWLCSSPRARSTRPKPPSGSIDAVNPSLG